MVTERQIVKVAKSGIFSNWGLHHSINLVDMYMHPYFYINQLVQLRARLTLT